VIYEPTIFVAIFLVILTFSVPRKYFLVPYVIAACFVPTDQRIIIMGLDFTILRILVVAGVLRIILYGEQRYIRWNKLDMTILLWVFCGAFIYVIQWMSTKAIINRLGVIFDVVGLYWLFRQNIRSWNDVKFVFTLLAISVVILMPLVVLEWSTGRNPFVVLGKVMTDVRAERYRCQGPFPHSIMLGLFCAMLVPLFVGLGITQKKRIFYWIAATAAVFIVMASASSTPILVLAIVLLGLLCFKWRRLTSKAGLCLLALLTALHVVMRAPVWHLLARVNVIGASTGWHRYNLIDKAIEHFGEWVFIGCRSTEHWGFGLGDITNQYILEGVRGGFITLLIFLVMIYRVLKTLLHLSLQEDDSKEQFLIWCLFTMIIGHCVAFLGVSYFGQITMLWYMMLAIAGLLAEYETFLANSADKAYSAKLSLANA